MPMHLVLFSQQLNWIEESAPLTFSIEERHRLMEAFASFSATMQAESRLPYTYICYKLCEEMQFPHVQALLKFLRQRSAGKSKPRDKGAKDQ